MTLGVRGMGDQVVGVRMDNRRRRRVVHTDVAVWLTG